MAIEFDPDQLKGSAACGKDKGRGFREIIDFCLENPSIYIDITSLGTIYERAMDYFEHRSKTHYATIGEEKVTSDAGPLGHHTTAVGDHTVHTDSDSLHETVHKRTVTNENYDVLTQLRIFMESLSRFIHAKEESASLTQYKTTAVEKRYLIGAGEDVDENDTYNEVIGLFDGEEVKQDNGWHPDDRIILSTHEIIKILGQKKSVVWNLAPRTCKVPREECCGGKYPIRTELADISPHPNGLPWAAFYPGIDTTQYNPFCLAEEVEPAAAEASFSAGKALADLGPEKVKAAVEGLAAGLSGQQLADAINNAQPEDPPPPPPIP
jgi:hypothetical protein